MEMPVNYVGLAKECAAFRALESAFSRGRGSHAYLLDSPDTLLSVCVALAVACADGCPQVCLTCPKCRRVLGGKCADVKIFGREGFLTEAADEVVSGCLITPSELKRKYYVLDLSRTNEAAQNKLLKTLEEAPECAVFFVIAPNRSSLLPTVVSRCETLNPALREGALAALDESSDPNYDLAVYGARGSMTEFDGLLSGEKAGSLTAALNFLRLIGSGRLLTAVGAFPNKREEMTAMLGYTELILGDIMKYESGLAVDTRGLYNISEWAEKFPLAGIPAALEAVRRAVRRAASGNAASIADALAITIAEVNEKCREL